MSAAVCRVQSLGKGVRRPLGGRMAAGGRRRSAIKARERRSGRRAAPPTPPRRTTLLLATPAVDGGPSAARLFSSPTPRKSACMPPSISRSPVPHPSQSLNTEPALPYARPLTRSFVRGSDRPTGCGASRPASGPASGSPLSGCVSVLCVRACVRAWLRAKRLRALLRPPSRGKETYAGLCHGADDTSRPAHMCRPINSTDTRVKS